jgi:hypothetical protein
MKNGVQGLLLGLALTLVAGPGWAQETVCARVKIEIKQELTLERQAFDAEMRINNTTDTGVIEEVAVEVKVTDENGTPIPISSDANDLNAKFYLRVSNMENIATLDGTGTVDPRTTSIINWLIIPSPGAAGNSPLGKKYLIGATLRYQYGGETHLLDVSPDVITVKPLPLLTLDYFLTEYVWADDPLTPEIEPVEPFTLGVRVQNTGMATAKGLKIDSAQPKIIENNQGLLINFVLTGSYVDDSPVQNTLLIDFGDIAASTSKMGRWNMETTLAGKFVEFSARFSHADELGGMLTSILQATNAHFLVRDVRVDLPGRDAVRDFLARDGDVLRVYESDAPDTLVTDRSGVASLVIENGNYRLNFPATAGFAYVRLPDPFVGSKAIGRVLRSDAKELSPDNVWLSKTRNEQSKQWEHWINLFDVNTTGVYETAFQAPPAVARPPVLQMITDKRVQETHQVSFLVEASSPDGRPVSLSADPLPAGASFTPQGADPQAPGLARAVFDWTPAKGSAGSYSITYTAADGALSASRSARIDVESEGPPAGPGTPSIVVPLSGAQVTALRPVLAVQTGAHSQDPTTQVQFELYADEAQTQLVGSALADKASGAQGVQAPTSWTVPVELADNTRYGWRARASDGQLYSPWVSGHFFVNTYNDPPDAFALLSPPPGAEVNAEQPLLSWANSHDKDGDRISYSVFVFTDLAQENTHASIAGLPDGTDGVGRWTVDPPLAAGATYYWQVIARDSNGAETSTAARPMIASDNQAPPQPQIVSPADGATVAAHSTQLIVSAVTDPDGDLLTYAFEIDRDPGFGSAARLVSGELAANGDGQAAWPVADLLENTGYYWRARATDGHTESPHVAARFFVNATNDAPGLPNVLNPGAGAWVSTRYPLFELNPAVDPEDDMIRYHFQISTQASEEGLLAQGEESVPQWRMPTALNDGSNYWWRYRVSDGLGASSPWSIWHGFTVKTGQWQPLVLQLTEPAIALSPPSVDGHRVTLLRWELDGLTEEANVSLYYSDSAGSATGARIVEGLPQAAGTRSGSYEWEVSDLPPGAYYVFAQIYTAERSARADAPGAIVIPPLTPSGGLMVRSGSGSTDEIGKTWTIQVRLNSAPTAEVIVPVASSDTRAGVVQPAQLVFTPQDWEAYKIVIVSGVDDCVRAGNRRYTVSVGKAQTVDPNFIGATVPSIPMMNFDNGSLSPECAP